MKLNSALVVFLFAIIGGCGEPFRVTGGYISKEEAASRQSARQAAAEQRKQEARAEAIKLAKAEKDAAEAAMLERDVKRAALRALWEERLLAWRDAYIAYAVSVREETASLDDICDAASAKTSPERQSAMKYYESFATEFRNGKSPDNDEVNKNHDKFERKFRDMAKLAVIEARQNRNLKESDKQPKPTPHALP